MAAVRLRNFALVFAAMSAVGLSGCGLMCDRYYDRQREKCHQYCSPPPSSGCYPSNSGYLTPTPVNQTGYPRPVDNSYCQ